MPRSVKWILALSLVARLLLARSIGPGFDEAYYYTYSLHPALSYADHPPMVAALAGLFPAITGIASAFTIRLGAVCLYTASSLLLYRLARALVSKAAAFLVLLLFNLIPLFLMGAGVFILPDSGMVFFWIASLLAFHRLIFRSPSLGLWVLAGLLTGLTFLSKYQGLMLAFLMLVYVVAYRRRWLLTPGPYVFALTALIVSAPVLIWNARHGFASFRFQASRVAGTSLSPVTFMISLGEQAAYITPMFLIPYLYVIWQTFERGVLKANEESRFSFVFGACPVLIVLSVSFLKPILPHWTLPGYLLLTVPLAALIKERMARARGVRSMANASFLIIVGLLGLAFLQADYGVLHLEKWAERKWIPRRAFVDDVTLDAFGWGAVEQYVDAHAGRDARLFLFSHQWYLSGEVALATSGRFPVFCFSRDNARGFSFWRNESTMVGRDAICICTNRHFVDAARVFGGFFESIAPPDSTVVRRGGVPSKTYYFWTCHRLLRPFVGLDQPVSVPAGARLPMGMWG
jgi:hypothetical protein